MNITSDVSHPLLEIKCANRIIRLSPFTWNKFAYFRLLMRQVNDLRTVILELETDFEIFFKFLSHDKLHTYFEIVTLREQILVFGLDPLSSLATHVGSVITDVINTTSNLKSTWDLLQCGWNEYIDDNQEE